MDIREYKRLHTKNRNKFSAQGEVVNGIKFHSRKEAEYARELQMKLAQGLIRGFTTQVSMRLNPFCSERIVIDFLVIHLDGTEQYIDTKGWDTPEGKRKRKTLRESMGIEITIV